MVHIEPDFKTKKEFIQALKDGRTITTYQPGGLFPSKQSGIVCIEAPAIFHRWYCTVEIQDQKVIRVIRQ